MKLSNKRDILGLWGRDPARGEEVCQTVSSPGPRPPQLRGPGRQEAGAQEEGEGEESVSIRGGEL